MFDKIRQLERILDPGQNDYLSALRERIHPIRGKASHGYGSYCSLGIKENSVGEKNDGYGYGAEYTFAFLSGLAQDPPHKGWCNGDGIGFGFFYGNPNTGDGFGAGIPEYAQGTGDGHGFDRQVSSGEDGGSAQQG